MNFISSLVVLSVIFKTLVSSRQEKCRFELTKIIIQRSTSNSVEAFNIKRQLRFNLIQYPSINMRYDGFIGSFVEP